MRALEAGQRLPEHHVRAHNEAIESENKIHDDAVARQYGFAGGLVPGVTVYAYMTHPAADALGPAWLERGTMAARFLKPFYEGQRVTVRTTVTAADDGVTLAIEASNDAGEVCATGTATLPAKAPVLPDPQAYGVSELPHPRPPASPEAFERTVLGTLHERFAGAETQAPYTALIQDGLDLYRGAEAPAHPGWLIRFANTALSANVRLGPWIHVSSDTRHLSLLRAGEDLEVRSKVVSHWERKGHRFVELDVLMLRRGERPVLHTRHTAIYEPRRA